ncbi:MAG: pyridoxamine 5'-phosphate oxidase family protein [Candidatus Omnitrophica bacterium]|nr:pyridoxamine 5'-phosphate oxidase family protein [Candidatus Omnitrophota bacterium]
MAQLTEQIIQFLQKQSFTVVTTIDKEGFPHNSCKGIVEIDPEGKIYLLDLYHGHTSENLKENKHISLTAVNEHTFKGYSLKGKARLVSKEDLTEDVMAAWDKKINKRITKRIMKNVTGKSGHPNHPEARLPEPKYMIVMEVGKIVDLTPQHLK